MTIIGAADNHMFQGVPFVPAIHNCWHDLYSKKTALSSVPDTKSARVIH
jgi:hypothetical protein